MAFIFEKGMMMNYLPHVLVVDDDERLRKLLHDYLSNNGYWVSVVSDTKEAEAILGEIEFDCLILDVMMPGETGVEFLNRKRKSIHTPIMMLTALSDAENRIEGLEIGADDYLSKPFEPKELLLRIGKLIARTKKESPSEIKFGEYNFDPKKLILKKAGEECYLTENELQLLKVLCDSNGEPVSRDALAEVFRSTPKSVDVMVGRLRRKLGDDSKMPTLITTVRGEGYALRVI